MLDIVALERAIEEGADTVFMTFGCGQHDARLRPWNGQRDPALRVHRLIGCELEPHLLGLESERPILIAGRNANEFELPDHACLRLQHG